MSEENKNPVGRPRLTLADLPEGWKEEMAALYSEGASDTEVRVMIGICNDTFYRFLNDEPEFSESVKNGRDCAKVWWEKIGRKGLVMGKDFNATAFIFQMKNRFRDDYNDSSTVNHNGAVPVKIVDDV